MQPDWAPDNASSTGNLLEPPYWLVFGLEWQTSANLAEAAFAIAPATIPRDGLGHDAYQVLGCADLYAEEYAARLVFFADLTRMFTGLRTSWTELGVNWETALDELRDCPCAAMFLTITEHAYLVICDPTPDDQPGQYEAAGRERELVRQALTGTLTEDWPACMADIISSGRVS